MLSTVQFVVAGLSTGNKIGLAVVAGIFIVFALVSSFLLPRRNPNFPGRRVGWYSALAVLFFVAMISAVLIFGRESEETTNGESVSNPNTLTVATAPPPETAPSGGEGSAAAGGGRGGRRGQRRGRQGRLRHGRLRWLPHAASGGSLRQGRPEPRRAEA